MSDRSVWGFVIAAISCGLVACADQTTASEAVEEQASALSAGTRQTLVDGITSAENLLITSDRRLLVSGDDGVFEIVAGPANESFSAKKLVAGQPCKFAGLAESGGFIYANCYDMTDSQLFAAPLSDLSSFQSIYALPGTPLANGLAADGGGHLYIASTFKGQILRLAISTRDPRAISEQRTFVDNAGLFANGLKFYRGALYWTDFGNIDAAAVLANGTAGPTRTMVSQLAFYDDIAVGDFGILAASELSGTVRQFDQLGLPNAETPANTFNGPSAVLLAAGLFGFDASALIVTERSGNRVSSYTR